MPFLKPRRNLATHCLVQFSLNASRLFIVTITRLPSTEPRPMCGSMGASSSSNVSSESVTAAGTPARSSPKARPALYPALFGSPDGELHVEIVQDHGCILGDGLSRIAVVGFARRGLVERFPKGLRTLAPAVPVRPNTVHFFFALCDAFLPAFLAGLAPCSFSPY